MRKKVYLLSACRNRNKDLLRVLPSWLHLSVDHILISDFGSDQSVLDSIFATGLFSKRISVNRLDDARSWVLSWAYNRVLSSIDENAIVVKIDCDDEATPKLINGLSHLVESLNYDHVLYGNWRNQHIHGKAYPSSGFFIAHASLIQRVGGFNPHILTYGWDDLDLYQRLIRHGAQLIDLPPYLLHSPSHSNEQRFGGQIKTWQQIEKNSLGLDFREISNQISRAVAEICCSQTWTLNAPIGFQEQLLMVGKNLLEAGLSFDKIIEKIETEYGFRRRVDKNAFLMFFRSSLYASSLRMALNQLGPPE